MYLQLKFETILPENIVVVDTSGKAGARKRKPQGSATTSTTATTQSDEEEDKLIEEAQTEEGNYGNEENKG